MPLCLLTGDCYHVRFLLFCDVKYLPLYDIKIFINVSREKCKERRFGYGLVLHVACCVCVRWCVRVRVRWCMHVCGSNPRRVSRRDPGTSEDYFERIIWPSYCRWNSHPLGLYEQRRLASDHTSDHDVAPKELQHAVEHDGILFINGEADVDEVFRSALDHINSRRQAHLTSSSSSPST